MTDVYKVGVTVTLNNMISAGLRLISKDLKATNADALTLQRTLKEFKTLGALSLAGIGGLAVLEKSIKAANDYSVALTKFKMMGIGDKMLSDADKFARGSQVIGASSTDLMNSLRNMTMMLGKDEYGAAKGLAPTMAALNWANHALLPDKWDESQEYAMEQVIEQRGGWKNGTWLKQTDMMQKVLSGTGGAVLPRDYQQFIKTAGVAGRLMDDRAFYYEMEPIIQEMGGQRVGTGLMSAYNNFYQGKSTVRAAREMMRLGLIDKMNVHYDKIGQIRYFDPGALKNSGLFTSDPGLWLQNVLVPALDKAGYKTEQQKIDELGALLGNRTGSALDSLTLMQWTKTLKNMKTSEGAAGVNETIAMAKNTLPGAMKELGAAWDKLETEAGIPLLRVVIPAINAFSESMRALADILHRHPLRTQFIVDSFAALSVGLAAALPVALMVRIPLMLFNVGKGFVGFAADLTLLSRTGLMLWASTSTVLPRLAALATPAVLGLGAVAAGLGALAYTINKVGGVKAAIEDLGATIGWLYGKVRHPIDSYYAEEDRTSDKLANMRGNVARVGPQSGSRVNVYNHFDRNGIATMVTEEQARMMNGPAKGYSGFDNRSGYMPVPTGGN